MAIPCQRGRGIGHLGQKHGHVDKQNAQNEAAEKVECFFSPENLIIEMIPDFVLFGIIFSILARLFLSKCAF